MGCGCFLSLDNVRGASSHARPAVCTRLYPITINNAQEHDPLHSPIPALCWVLSRGR